MGVRQILKLGNAALYKTASSVADPTAPALHALHTDMFDTLAAVKGCGIAAPQIGVEQRVVLYCIPEDRIPFGAKTRPVPWTLMVNPVITPLRDAKVAIWERCLSLPGLYGQVPRYQHIGLRFQTTDGKLVEYEATGFHGMILQHECDHLDGVLYPMRMTDMTKLSFVSELRPDGEVYKYRAEEFD
jgi:peptide deformylase